MSPLSEIRRHVQETYLTSETEAVQILLDRLQLTSEQRGEVEDQCRELVQELREAPSDGLIEDFLIQYQLSTAEGVALMCLAEAFLRTPDAPTLDALIRDKVGRGNWSKSNNYSDSNLVNVSAWALMIAGRVLQEREIEELDLKERMRLVIQRLGEPIARAAIGQAMRLLGQQFVLGETIEDALDNGQNYAELGYNFSFDMLGEGARTAADAQKYYESYWATLEVLEKHANDGELNNNPAMSVKISALHPRYEFNQIEKLRKELVPRLVALVERAARANIGLTIDAEEADRLDLSLELIEATLREARLGSWDGFGIAVQAYSKQAPEVIDWFAELARELKRPVKVRLVKGAYWDTEIKNAQVKGMPVFPVYTRKPMTDLSYYVCAEKLFSYSSLIYPQFATHNALTALVIKHMADGKPFEFQRLHGMGEVLHNRLLEKFEIPSRIYAPVGIHEDLLAYLVRRLLENGANSSFIHQLRDRDVPVDHVIQDPVAELLSDGGATNANIRTGTNLFRPERKNSAGINIDIPVFAEKLEADLEIFKDRTWTAKPLVPGWRQSASGIDVISPADTSRIVGKVFQADTGIVDIALEKTVESYAAWNERSPEDRAGLIDKVADLYEAHSPELIALTILEAGKTRLDGILELREAVDFCRYYAQQARDGIDHSAVTGRGPFVCISPWNFPLAIFTGQIVAALVSGNTVIAKPAEQTPLIAARAVSLMHEAGIPEDVLIMLPGQGHIVGDALTRDPRVQGVCFTGSTQTAQIIDRNMASHGNPLAPLIAETGGVNSMIVDSTALTEQVIDDVITSAFQSAGQRCSALRLLCLQEECADRTLEMLQGAMAERSLGDPWMAQTDIGPLIDKDAQDTIGTYCNKQKSMGRVLFEWEAGPVPETGHFLAPIVVRLDKVTDLRQEIFGPVLHVVTFSSEELETLSDKVNASGFGLTFGMHSRVDGRIDEIADSIHAGNIYINRNQIGAVVGVQPFGGEGLSGTGPKAGGPNYLSRFVQKISGGANLSGSGVDMVPDQEDADQSSGWSDWDFRLDVLRQVISDIQDKDLCSALKNTLDQYNEDTFASILFNGPTGESNELNYHSCGTALCAGGSDNSSATVASQVFKAIAAENTVIVSDAGKYPGINSLKTALEKRGMPVDILTLASQSTEDLVSRIEPDVILFDGESETFRTIRIAAAKLDGARTTVLSKSDSPQLFASERVISEDTTAAGGNASLLAQES